jgi:hypothetical protein
MIRRKYKTGNRGQSGYALLLVVFLAAFVLIGTMSIGLRVYTEGKREKEKEMIWRGNQYVRGIKLHFRKFGRFPTSMDNLTKPSVGNIRFMRQEYKDPMNKEDGSWRLIYVGPAGQLIGSLKPRPAGFALFGSRPIPPLPRPGVDQNPTQPGGTAFGTGTTPSGAGATGTDTGASGTTPSGTDLNPQPVATGDAPTIIGGNIIGVGSKVDQSSLIVYEQASNYKQFEFIWDPSKELGIGVAGQQPAVPGQTGAPGVPQPGAPQNPNPNPSPTNPNPQP